MWVLGEIKMEENQRQFQGIWIDKTLWLDKRLNALEKIIYAEIQSLDDEETGCFASNEYLAEFCQCSVPKISIAISKLIKLGYLELKSFNGRKRVLKIKSLPYKIYKADIDINNNNIKEKENNKDYNNIYNAVIDYLNQKAGTQYRSTTQSTQRHIGARIREGYTEQDLKAVIDKKVKEWKGTEWEKYLRPETLFGNKFENYLNAKVNNNQEKEATKREYTDEDYSSMMDDINEIEI